MRIIKIKLILFLFFSIKIFAQNDSSLINGLAEPKKFLPETPAIDLPEFQITGTDLIPLPELKKDTVNEDKYFSTDGLVKSIKEFDLKQNGRLIKKSEINRDATVGKILLSGGNLNNHAIEGWFGKNYNEGGILFHGLTNGINDKNRNAKNDKWGISIGGNLLIDKITTIDVPLRTRGEFSILKNSYNTFASAFPTDLNLENTNLKFGVDGRNENIFSFITKLNYNIDFNFQNFLVNKNNKDLREDNFVLNGKSYFNLFNYPFGFEFNYINPTSKSKYYFSNSFSAGGNILENISYRASFEIFSIPIINKSSEVLFYPNAELKYKQNEKNVYYLKFTPTVRYKNLKNYFEINPFIDFTKDYNYEKLPIAFSFKSENKISEKLELILKTSFEKINNSTSYISVNDSQKIWKLVNISNVEHSSFEIKLINQLTETILIKPFILFDNYLIPDSSKQMPHLSPFKIGFILESNPIENLSFEAYLFYNSKRWIDFRNENSLNSFFDSGIKAEYLMIEKLKIFGTISNLLNQKIYYWNDYKEKGISFLLGLTYSW